ncbi:MAG TPA: tRNA pseudouridine(55) synthase, partial [Candidatus Saccharimonadia bacterium]|nr:tRNA pseudouridine(55) synthase [Candidatus Saccharimonadia bacterium]
IKVGGQRAYKLARAGKTVELEPRQVTINRLEVLEYTYPEVKLLADVSSGTYIRSLVEDIGQALGTGAYTSALRRTRIKDYSVTEASSLKGLNISASLRA